MTALKPRLPLLFSQLLTLLAMLAVLIPLRAAAYSDSEILAQEMYVAYYGRPADLAGLQYWATRFDQSRDLEQALAAFGASQEYTLRFGDLSNSELINGLYQQMFNRDSDESGLNFYLHRFESGQASLASIAKQIADGALASDRDSLNNKVFVANKFTDRIDESFIYSEVDIAPVSELLKKVDNKDSSVVEGLMDVEDYGESEPRNTACTEPRPQFCTMDYNPVCATRDNGIRCITTPCDSTEKATYSNACTACADTRVYYYRGGACEW